MVVKYALLLATSLLFLAGCSGNDETARDQANHNPLQPQIDAMRKARNVEQVLQQSARERDRQLELQSR